MMKNICCLLALSLLGACTHLSENEKKGIKQIEDIYEGKCDCSRDESRFTIHLSKSHMVIASTDLEVPASNCAYLFYTSLPMGGERENYSSVIVKIEQAGLFKDQKFEKEYSAPMLQQMVRNARWLDTVVGCIRRKDFQYIIDHSHSSVFDAVDTNTYFKKMQLLGKLAGDVKSGTVMGFTSTIRNVNGKDKELAIINGRIQTGGGKWDLTLMIDPNARPDEKRFYGFKWDR
jgi:hypothetical protein